MLQIKSFIRKCKAHICVVKIEMLEAKAAELPKIAKIKINKMPKIAKFVRI